MAILTVNNIKQSFGEETILENITFEMQKGERVGLVGVNGSGKTTLFKVLTGEYTPDTGSVVFGKDTVLGYMEQHVCRDFEKTALDEVMTVFAPLLRMERELEDINQLLSAHPGDQDLEKLILRQTQLNDAFVDGGGLTCRSRARSALMGLGFTEEQLTNKVGVLSGGQKAKPGPTSCCWTSPPTTWTSPRWSGWRASSPPIPGPISSSPTTGTSWTR